MIKNLEKHIQELRNFQSAFGAENNFEYTDLPKDRRALRVNMYDEEAEEFLKAYRMNDTVEIGDAISDENFLVLGDLVSSGVSISRDELREDFDWYSVTTETPKHFTLVSLAYSDKMLDGDEEDIKDSILNRLVSIALKSKMIYGENWEDITSEMLTHVYESNMSKLKEDGTPLINGEGFTDPNKPLGKILKNPSTYFEPTEGLINIFKKYNIG